MLLVPSEYDGRYVGALDGPTEGVKVGTDDGEWVGDSVWSPNLHGGFGRSPQSGAGTCIASCLQTGA